MRLFIGLFIEHLRPGGLAPLPSSWPRILRGPAWVARRPEGGGSLLISPDARRLRERFHRNRRFRCVRLVVRPGGWIVLPQSLLKHGGLRRRIVFAGFGETGGIFAPDRYRREQRKVIKTLRGLEPLL